MEPEFRNRLALVVLIAGTTLAVMIPVIKTVIAVSITLSALFRALP